MANRVVYSKAYDSEIEYLESTGTQWIDTGIIPEQRYSAECTFSDAKYGFLFGCRKSITLSPQFCVCLASTYNGSVFFQYGNPTSNNGEIRGLDITSMHTVKLGEQCYYDGELVATKGSTWSSTTALSIYLFAYNQNGSSSDRREKAKIYWFKIYNQNNNLVRDLIPVRVGSVGYMYDKVSGKLFGNKGTGNFILGQDVANPIPNIRRVFRFENKRFVIHMPYDSKIEYLESTGIQYIYIPFTLNKGDNAYCSVYVTDTELTNGNVIFMSSTDSRNKYGLSILNRKMWLVAFANSGVSGQDIYYDYNVWRNVSIIYNANKNKYIFNVDNTNLTSQTPAYNSVSGIYLFCRNNLLENAAKARISSLKIKRNGNYILDLIPVRKDNVGYMYDRVSGKLFGNSGTGQFILGNDIN